MQAVLPPARAMSLPHIKVHKFIKLTHLANDLTTTCHKCGRSALEMRINAELYQRMDTRGYRDMIAKNTEAEDIIDGDN